MRIVVNNIAASKTGALSILKDFYNAVVEYEKGSPDIVSKQTDSPDVASKPVDSVDMKAGTNEERGCGNEWIFVLGDRLLEETGNIKVLVRDDIKASRKKRLMFDLKDGAEYFMSLKPDVLFSMQNTLPRGYKGRQVLYVHQPLPFQTWKKFSFFKPEEREYAVYQHLIGRMIGSSVKRSDKVIVQTQWMKDAVVKKTGVSADKVVKILPDIKMEHEVGSSVLISECESDGNIYGERTPGETKEQSPCPNRFFYPAGEILYKNHSCILEAVGILKDRGINDFNVSFTLNKGDIPTLARYPEHEQIKYLGRIDRDEVFKRYRSEILLFPSYIETFGYPPAESRAVGGRVIASDCPFCHEVLEGYDRAVFFDPFDPKQLADHMEKTINGELFAGGTKAGDANGSENTDSWNAVIKELIETGDR